MRELREPSSKPPPIVSPSELKPRPSSNNPVAGGESPPVDLPAEELSSRHLVAAVTSETEIETVYEARILTPSSPSSEAVRAEPEPSVSMPLPLVRRTSRPPPPPPSSDDASKKP